MNKSKFADLKPAEFKTANSAELQPKPMTPKHTQQRKK